jgi:nucleotide-binding universal stress UspA family protein
MFQTILVPLDGSKRAEKILPYVEGLALTREAKVIFLQVLDLASFMSESSMMLYYSEDRMAAALREAQKYLECVVKDFCAKGIVATSLVKEGQVVRVILGVAEEEKVDLIAMASHGRTGLAQAFYGSVAAGILNQADRPLRITLCS